MEFARAQPAEKKRKALAKVERAVDRQAKEEDKGIYKLMAEADEVFGKFIRMRDRLAGHDCISSGEPLDWWTPNRVDAGHFRTKGAASHLRYDEDNCHAQTKRENRYKAGNAIEYRPRLINRIGLEKVERLESDNQIHKWTREELRQIKVIYRGKLRDLLRQKD
jgi:hypothetical protein